MTRVTQLIHDAGKYLLISVYPLPTHPTHNFNHNNGGNLETLPGWPKKLQHNRPARSAGQWWDTLVSHEIIKILQCWPLLIIAGTTSMAPIAVVTDQYGGCLSWGVPWVMTQTTGTSDNLVLEPKWIWQYRVNLASWVTTMAVMRSDYETQESHFTIN